MDVLAQRPPEDLAYGFIPSRGDPLGLLFERRTRPSRFSRNAPTDRATLGNSTILWRPRFFRPYLAQGALPSEQWLKIMPISGTRW